MYTFLRKDTPYPAQTNYSRRVDYRPMGATRIERTTGWHIIDLSKVSVSSRKRLHKVLQIKGRSGYVAGMGHDYYLFV